MKKMIALMGVALLAGCTTPSAELIPHGNGGDGYVVECNGPLQTWGNCYREASIICKGGYFEVDNAQAVARPFGGMFIIGSSKDRSMVVRCDQVVEAVELTFVD